MAMGLRALVLVACGPALTFSQVQQIAATPAVASTSSPPPDSVSVSDDWAPGFLGRSTEECAKMPAIPQIFHARRVFFSFFNTIVFTDRHNNEFGFVESWAGDSKNPLGFAGASFYLKAEPVPPADSVWNMAGPTAGEDGTFNQPLTHEALAKNEQQMLGGDSAIGHGNLRNYDDQKTATEAGRGWFDTILRAFSTQNHHRLAAFMVGDQSGGANPFAKADVMTVRDCKGRAQVKAYDGKLIFRDAKDAQYYQKVRNTENSLIVTDLGNPPRDLVRVVQKQPCSPFPPFCAQMGMWNWFLHGTKWDGEVVVAGTNNDMSSLLGADATMTVSMSSGEAEDMRFLTLYTAYQFSNTRWSPFMNWVWVFLVVCPLLCCIYGCCCRGGGSPPKAEREETQKLMETKEAPKEKKEEKRTFMACCSRFGGQAVAPKD